VGNLPINQWKWTIYWWVKI